MSRKRAAVIFHPLRPTVQLLQDAVPIIVPNSHCAPRYMPGEIIFVSPKAPIRPGDFIYGEDSQERGVSRFLGECDGMIDIEFFEPWDGQTRLIFPRKPDIILRRIIGTAH